MKNIETDNSKALKKSHFFKLLEEVILACNSKIESSPVFESTIGFKCTMKLANALKSNAPDSELLLLLGYFDATMLVHQPVVSGFEEEGRLPPGFSYKICRMREELTACLSLRA